MLSRVGFTARWKTSATISYLGVRISSASMSGGRQSAGLEETFDTRVRFQDKDDSDGWGARKQADDERMKLLIKEGKMHENQIEHRNWDRESKRDDRRPPSIVQKPKDKSKKKKIVLDPAAVEEVESLRIRGFLEINTNVCSGCGASFQTNRPDSPGYLSKEKFKEHRMNAAAIRDKQEALKILDTAGIDVNTPEAETIVAAAKLGPEVLKGIRDIVARQERANEVRRLKTPGEHTRPPPELMPPKPEEGEELYSLRELKAQEAGDVVCTCQRCFRLQQYGQIENSLRPGWSTDELLTPERFQSLLEVVRDNKAVVVCLVDLFDLQGSLLPNLKEIAGKNPIIIAANKVDLLPKDVSRTRLKDWLHDEIKLACQLVSPTEMKAIDRRIHTGRYYPDYFDRKISEAGVLKRSNIHFVSCSTGAGMDELMRNVYSYAKENEKKVYVMGAANVGKSSFINRLLESKQRLANGSGGGGGGGKKVDQKRLDENPQSTVSNLPGTTLNFLKIRMPNGVIVYDTPGLLKHGQLTAKLTPEELRMVVPKKSVNPVSLRVAEGKCVLMGGLAKIELVEGKPVFFTFFIANDVVLHPTDATRADDYIQTHIGKLLTPPASMERLAALGEPISEIFEIQGDSWKKASFDIVIAGLGWVAITGPGLSKIKITVPTGTSVAVRPALLPYELPSTTASFTGTSMKRKDGRFTR